MTQRKAVGAVVSTDTGTEIVDWRASLLRSNLAE